MRKLSTTQRAPSTLRLRTTLTGSLPDHRKDPKSRSPNLGPYTTKGYFKRTPFGDLFFRSFRWSGLGVGGPGCFYGVLQGLMSGTRAQKVSGRIVAFTGFSKGRCPVIGHY